MPDHPPLTFSRQDSLAFLALLLSLLLAACGNSGGSVAAPTPAGLPQGKPTLVYLYTFP